MAKQSAFSNFDIVSPTCQCELCETSPENMEGIPASTKNIKDHRDGVQGVMLGSSSCTWSCPVMQKYWRYIVAYPFFADHLGNVLTCLRP